MKNAYLLLILCLGLITQIEIKANHIIGGDLVYQCTSSGVYDFQLTLYRDALGIGPALGNETITVYKQGSIEPFLNIGIGSTLVVTEVEPDLSNICPESIPPIDIEQGIYEFALELPNDPDGYVVVFQRCCRNLNILNINDPSNLGATFHVEIPPSNNPNECVNNSASFNNYPPIIICNNNFMIFDHAATDIDGDSLVYEICPPLLGASNFNPQPVPNTPPPYEEVPWANNYNSQYQIPSDPAMAIDPQTGILTLNPTQLGLYVTAICVHEYRDGELINTVSRDFQFNITDCESMTAVISSNTIGNTDLNGDPIEEISFNNDTIIGCVPMIVNFDNETEGADGFYWDLGNGALPEFTETPFSPALYPVGGTYSAFMVAYNNECNIEDTIFFNIKAIDPDVTTSFEAIFPEDCEDLTMSFINETILPSGTENYNYKWLLGNDSIVQGENINNFTYLVPDLYEVSLITTVFTPCFSSDTMSMTIPVGCGVATEDKHQSIDRCQVYPNPSADVFHLELTNTILDQEQLNIKVYDITGQLILSLSDMTIDLSNQEAGIYLLQLFHEDLLIEQEKLVLMK